MEQLNTCKNCGHQFIGKFCNNCGEKVYTNHDKSVAHFFEEGFHYFTHFDGKFFTTLKTLFTRPGKLSTDYSDGIRKPYFKPLSLFLLLVVIYLLFPVFEGLNMRLYYHAHHNVYGAYATKKIAAVIHETGLTEGQLTDAFHIKSEKVSKFLLVIILPLTALFLWLLTFRKRPLFFDQMIFSTEVNSLYLIWGFIILPFVLVLLQKVFAAIGVQQLTLGDGSIGYLIYVPLLLYVGIAARKFYHFTYGQAVLLAFAFYAIHYIVIQVVYKFLLFALVINQIH